MFEINLLCVRMCTTTTETFYLLWVVLMNQSHLAVFLSSCYADPKLVGTRTYHLLCLLHSMQLIRCPENYRYFAFRQFMYNLYFGLSFECYVQCLSWKYTCNRRASLSIILTLIYTPDGTFFNPQSLTSYNGSGLSWAYKHKKSNYDINFWYCNNFHDIFSYDQ